MDGLGKAVGSPFPFDVNGKAILFQPLTLRLLGSVEHHLAITYGTRFQIADYSRSCLPTDAQHLFDEIAGPELKKFRPDISMSDTLSFLATPDGTVLSAWLCGGVENLPVHLHRSWRRARDLASGLDETARREWDRMGRARPSKTDTFMHWGARIAGFIDSGFSMEDIGRLTIYQMVMLSQDRKALEGKRPISREEALGRLRHRKRA